MFRTVGIACLLLTLTFAQETKFHEHPDETIEDLFHDLDTTEEANKLIDEVLRVVYVERGRDDVPLDDKQFDLRHILPDGKGTLRQGTLEGIRNVIRRGDAQFHKEGDDDVITVRATLLFPQLRMNWDEAEVQSRDDSVRAALRGEYNRLLVSLVISHRHLPDHSNTVDEFQIKGYRQSTFRLILKDRTARKISLTATEVMEETRIPLLDITEKALRKILDEHVQEWR